MEKFIILFLELLMFQLNEKRIDDVKKQRSKGEAFT